MSKNGSKLNWFRVMDKDELPEGRVKTVTAGHIGLAMTHFEGKICALSIYTGSYIASHVILKQSTA